MFCAMYLITLLLFSSCAQSSQCLEESRADLSRIDFDENDSGIGTDSVSNWRIVCRKFNYTIMQRPDGIKSFRFFPLKKLSGFNLLIDNEQGTYLLKTTRNPNSYCQMLMQDCDELLGASQEEKKDVLLKMSTEDLTECLKKKIKNSLL